MSEFVNEGRYLYDKVRPIFDVSNPFGLEVHYGEREPRPHLRNKFIQAIFVPSKTDTFQPFPGHPMEFFPGRVYVSMFLRPSDPNDIYHDGIMISIRTYSDVGLLPDGNTIIDPSLSVNNREIVTVETHSIFRLVAELIETGRIQPDKQFDSETAPRIFRPVFPRPSQADF